MGSLSRILSNRRVKSGDGLTISSFIAVGNSNRVRADLRVKRFESSGGRNVSDRGVELHVELCAEEDAEGDDVEPEEQSDAGTERSVDQGVVGEAGDVPAEDEGGEEPHDGGGDGSGKSALPGLPDGRSHVIDECDDGRRCR